VSELDRVAGIGMTPARERRTIDNQIAIDEVTETTYCLVRQPSSIFRRREGRMREMRAPDRLARARATIEHALVDRESELAQPLRHPARTVDAIGTATRQLTEEVRIMVVDTVAEDVQIRGDRIGSGQLDGGRVNTEPRQGQRRGRPHRRL
jgi:hypothetical protein